MFKLPEDITVLSEAELATLRQEALDASKALLAIEDDKLTDEQIDEIALLADAVASIEAEQESRAQKNAERAEKLAAARKALAEKDEDADEDKPDAEPEDDEPLDVEVPDDASELLEKESVAASGRIEVRTRKTALQAAAEKAKPLERKGRVNRESGHLTASANIPGFEAGAKLDGMDDFTEAFLARSRNFKNLGGGEGANARFERFGVGQLHKPKNEFEVDFADREGTFATIMDAAKVARLGADSLVAAGGWCAPSETIYDFCALETVSGLISVPEVTVRRGGINFTKGPDYGSIVADADFGFLQTEAQAEAGTTKACYTIECPPFEEVRLDAIGFCIKNGILTNVGYPELTKRVLQIAMAGHAHKINYQTILRIANAIGAATNYTEVGSATADVLDALNLQGVVLRYQYALDPNAELEVILPVWAKEIIRADLSRRTGVDMLAVTDAQIIQAFSVRNLAPQFVYDYQPIPVTGGTVGQAWPTTLEALIYPAGAYVRGGTDVIDLDTVYDSTGLSTNTYTAAFFEEGILVANTCGSGRKVQIDITRLFGETGAADLGLPAAA